MSAKSTTVLTHEIFSTNSFIEQKEEGKKKTDATTSFHWLNVLRKNFE